MAKREINWADVKDVGEHPLLPEGLLRLKIIGVESGKSKLKGTPYDKLTLRYLKKKNPKHVEHEETLYFTEGSLWRYKRLYAALNYETKGTDTIDLKTDIGEYVYAKSTHITKPWENPKTDKVQDITSAELTFLTEEQYEKELEDEE